MVMKLRTIVAFLLIIGVLNACKKDPQESENKTEEISINGKNYTTVKIGNKVWTSVNYSGEGGIFYREPNTKPEYGKYYSFSETQSISLPQGWRIPTEADWRSLTDALGIVFQNNVVTQPDLIKKLTAKTNWLHVQGTNESGFNAYPGGYSVGNNPPMDGDLSEFWMADGKTFSILENANQVSYRIVFYAASNQPLDRFNLRFVKDAN